MDQNSRPTIVHVGLKGRIATVPPGWHLITWGISFRGDMYANSITGKFHEVDLEDIGFPADAFDALIRKY